MSNYLEGNEIRGEQTGKGGCDRKSLESGFRECELKESEK